MAFPHALLTNLGLLGVATSLPDLPRLSVATRARLALSSGSLGLALADISGAIESDEALLYWPMRDWLASSNVLASSAARALLLFSGTFRSAYNFCDRECAARHICAAGGPLGLPEGEGI